jgi:hypothetical protein
MLFYSSATSDGGPSTGYIGRGAKKKKMTAIFKKLIGYAALAASLMAPVAFG